MKLFAKILAGTCMVLSAQTLLAAPPKLMIIPDKTWCVSKGYVIETERNGKVRQTEDYDKALIDPDFKNVQLAISQFMTERGFPVVSGESQSEADDEDEMFDEAFEGAETGSEVQTNAYDELLKRNKPDITLKIGWNIHNSGSLYSADYRIEAIDTYSNKSVAPIAGQTGEQRRIVPLSVALKQTAKNNMGDFCQKLRYYFDDIQERGREIRLDVRIIDNGAGTTMNQEFEGKELSQIIYDWVSDNTVEHQFSQRSGGRNMARYDQVIIPYRGSNGRPQDASHWVKGLQDKLKSLGLVAENASTGLGAARIYIGEK